MRHKFYTKKKSLFFTHTLQLRMNFVHNEESPTVQNSTIKEVLFY